MKNMMSKKQLERVRRICSALPETTERLSHGEPTFFVHNKVFVMFADNHHNDGHIAVWLPVPSGLQTTLIETSPETYFRPPYVGVRGWVGIELDRISEKDLTFHIQVAWELIAPKRLLSRNRANNDPTKPSQKRSSQSIMRH
ncbi:MAG TPA: MmcQ/YjbR family DNA-binding protein [Anaerolineales bacterium]